MDQFERQFEHLDVQTQSMDEAMSGVTTLTIPEVIIHIHVATNQGSTIILCSLIFQDQVTGLMQEASDEAG